MIIVTGSEGFIGKHLVEHYRRKRINVQCYDSKVGAPAKYAIPFIEKAKAVFHLSCLTQEMCEQLPNNAWEFNALDTKRLAEECAKFNVPLIYTSSCSIYGNGTTRHEEYETPKPLSTYAVTKLAGEHFIRATPGLSYSILRLSNVYGPGQDPKDNSYCGFIGKAFSAAYNNKPIKVIGSGEQTRDWTYVDDVIDALVLAAARWPSLHQTFNIASGNSVSVSTVAEKISKVTGAPIEYFEPLRSCDLVKNRYISNRAAQAFLWEPHTSLVEGLAHTNNLYWAKHKVLA